MYFSYGKNDSTGMWNWHLKAANHEIIAHGEPYTSEENCLLGINLVQSSFEARVIKRPPMLRLF